MGFRVPGRAAHARPLQQPHFTNTSSNMHFVRKFSSTRRENGSPRLPVLTQTHFFKMEDMEHEQFLDPVTYLKMCPAVQVVRQHNKLLRYYSREPLMLTGKAKELWQSAVELVFFNKLRGYDIAKGLDEGDLEVSASSGTFALKELIADVYDGSKPFMGYEALEALFQRLMKRVYGESVIISLSQDVKHFLRTLLVHKDDRLCLYHAALLSPSGRAWLSIGIHSIFCNEVNVDGFRWSKEKIYNILHKLPYTSSDGTEKTDAMHPFFGYWRNHSDDRRSTNGHPQMQKPEKSEGKGCMKRNSDEAESLTTDESNCRKRKSQVTLDECQGNSASPSQPKKRKIQGIQDEAQPPPAAPKDETLNLLRKSAYSVAALNRNGVLHRISPKQMEMIHQKLPKKMLKFLEPFPGRRYCLWEIVQLLHYYMPLYLPEAQYWFCEQNLWAYLEMGSFWPRAEIYHSTRPMHIGELQNDQGSSYQEPDYLTLFVGSLDPSVTEEDLKQVFVPFGKLAYVHVPLEKGFGFVKFLDRASAEKAKRILDGETLGGKAIRVEYSSSGTKKKKDQYVQGPREGHYDQCYDNYAWAKSAEEERDKQKKKSQSTSVVQAKDGHNETR